MKGRKLLALFLAALLCLGLFAGCGDSTENKSKEVSVEEVKEEAPAAATSEAKAEEEKEEPKAEEPKAEETKEESKAEEVKEESQAEEAEEEPVVEEPAEDITAESLLNGYFDTADDIESIAFDMSMNADLNMVMAGEEMALKMTMNVYSETYGDNSYMKGNMEMEEAGEQESQSVEQYTMLEDGKYVSYTYDTETDSWSSYESDKPTISKELIPKLDVSKFELTEEGDQYKISGALDVNELLETMGETFGSLFEGILGSSEGIIGQAEVEYFFNKETKALTAVHLDMAKALEETFSALLEGLFSMQLGTGDGEEEISAEDFATMFKVTVSAFDINLDNIVLNEGSEIILPEEAAAAVAEG